MKYILTLLMIVSLCASVQADVFGSTCPTLEQQQAAYNQKMANSVVVTNTASQQLQCYYQQLATYYQQLDKDNQQKAKDAQQVAKDQQQVAKDIQQMATDKDLATREYALHNTTDGYDETDLFIQAILPLLGACDTQLRSDITRIHTNRSGGGDLTNPGGGGNLQGFDNPHKVH